MKTNSISLPNAPIFYIVGFLSIILTSCGSYQNSSYYDRDGIYGNSESTNTQRINTQSEPQVNSNNRYKDYFSSLQDDNQSTEIFTDIDNYNYTTKNEQATDSNYADWGNNYQKASINIYPNQWNLSMGWGMGWGNPIYGWGYSNYGWNYPNYFGYSGYGWGYPSFGWGYPSFGWNYPYYGYSNYNNYSYNPSRRGSSYSNNANSTRNYNNRSSRDYSKNQINSNREGNSTYNSTRTSPTFSRNRFQSQDNSNSTPNRRANPINSRSESTINSRTYTPSPRDDSNSSSRSYSPSNSGSSNDSGRSSGGGGRRR